MLNTFRSRHSVRLALLFTVLTVAGATPALAYEWECRSGSSNVIDCRSGTCVPMEPYEPSLWTRIKCALGVN